MGGGGGDGADGGGINGGEDDGARRGGDKSTPEGGEGSTKVVREQGPVAEAGSLKFRNLQKSE